MSAITQKPILGCKLAQKEIYFSQPQILLLLGKTHRSNRVVPHSNSNSCKEVLVLQSQ